MMVNSKRLWSTLAFCLLALACLALVAAWHNEGARFNERLTDANAELGRSGHVFGSTLQRLIQAEQPDLDEARRAYQKLKSAFAAVSTQMTQLDVPELPLADELYATHQAFLAGQQDIIENDMREMVSVLESPETSKQERSQKLKAIARRIAEKHTADFSKFEAMQEEFAQQNGFRIR